MAAGIIGAPGTEYGPCEQECHHRDCAENRALAHSSCSWCREPIGFDTMFYRDDAEEGDGLARYVHRVCAEQAWER